MSRKTIHLAIRLADFRHADVLSSTVACGTEWLADNRISVDMAAVTCKRCMRSSRAREIRRAEGIRRVEETLNEEPKGESK